MIHERVRRLKFYVLRSESFWPTYTRKNKITDIIKIATKRKLATVCFLSAFVFLFDTIYFFFSYPAALACLLIAGCLALVFLFVDRKSETTSTKGNIARNIVSVSVCVCL